MSVDPPPPHVASPVELGYSSRPAWHRRRGLRWWLGLIVAATLAAAVYLARDFLMANWSRFELGWAEWRCLHHSQSADTVVYDERPSSAATMLSDSQCTRLVNGAVARQSPLWPALKAAMGPAALYLAQQDPGGVVFLHERAMPDGARVLVYSLYGDDPQIPGRGTLTTFVLGIPKLGEPPVDRGGMHDDDFTVFSNGAADPLTAFKKVLPHPDRHRLVVYAGEPDPKDSTAFSFVVEVDGRRGTVTVSLHRPFSAPAVANWPDGWPDIETHFQWQAGPGK